MDGGHEMNSVARRFERRLAAPSSPEQRTAYAAIGIVIPILCLWFDPIVFYDSMSGGLGILKGWILPAGLFFSLEFLALGLWLAAGSRLGFAASVISGVLAAGSLGAILIGGAMLPATLIGMFFLIGFLGLAPFFTAWVFARTAAQAWACGRTSGGTWANRSAAAIGFVFTVAFTLLAGGAGQETIDRSLKEVISDDPARAERAYRILRVARPIADVDSLVHRYVATDPNSPQRELIARAYERLTGWRVEDRFRAVIGD